jgi:hypothetical protein
MIRRTWRLQDCTFFQAESVLGRSLASYEGRVDRQLGLLALAVSAAATSPAYHGQATLCRWRLKNPRVIRFRSQSGFWRPRWFLPRTGQRCPILIAGDLNFDVSASRTGEVIRQAGYSNVLGQSRPYTRPAWRFFGEPRDRLITLLRQTIDWAFVSGTVGAFVLRFT